MYATTKVTQSFYHALVRMEIPMMFTIARLRNKMNKCHTIEDYVNLSFDFYCASPLKQGSIRPAHVKEEITGLLKILERYKLRLILEIGTGGGGTLFLLSRVATPDATLISVDLPGGPFGGGYPKWRIPLYTSFTLTTQKLHLIRSDSHKSTTLHEIEGILKNRKFDLLLIDGDHSYEGVKMDFEMYTPYVGKGAIVAFHDIVPGPSGYVGGVPRLWCELRNKYQTVEIVRDRSQGGYGIGVIYI